MAPLPLLGGFYVARSKIAGAARCVNLYPEKNPQDSEQPYTLYPTPGLTVLAVSPTLSRWRGLYLATNSQLYGVCGQTLYFIDANFICHALGNLAANVLTPVSMSDNGLALICVDGTTAGYAVNLASNAFGVIADPNFLGGTTVDYIDTFFVLNSPGTNVWYSSLSNVTYGQLTSSGAFDPTYVAAKTGTPDPISALKVMHREIWILGSLKTSEVWYDAGNAAFPFAIASGVFLEQACIAPYSLVKEDLSVYWLGINKDGQRTIWEGNNYIAKRISTPAIAALLSQLPTVSDCISLAYVQQDHVFIIFNFPSANRTIVWDTSERVWHERTTLDINGNELCWRVSAMVQAYGIVVAGDISNGALYQIDLNNYSENGVQIIRRRGYVHLVDDGKLVSYPAFRADMEVGDWAPPAKLTLYLRWSDDRGQTWGNPIGQTALAGQRIFQPEYRKLGAARDRVFELFWSDPVETALQGAWLDPPPVSSGS